MVDWPVNELANADLIRKGNTLMRIVLHIPNPEDLSDDEWGMRYEEIRWAAKAGFLSFKLD